MSEKTNPNEIKLSNAPIKIKLNAKGVASALVRTAFDIAKRSPSSATTVEWIKALGLKTPKEKQAFTLITNALIDAFQEQLKTRIDQSDLDENKNLVSNGKILQFDIFSKLSEGEYTFNCAYFEKPHTFPFLGDFKPLYKKWLLQSFPISEEHVNLMVADFPDYFAGKFYNCLKDKSKYAALIDWCNDPMMAKWAKDNARKSYKTQLKSYYQLPALGEEQVALADVYVQPSFLVFDRILSEEKQTEIREKDNVGNQQHFLPTDFNGSIHDYLKNNFLVENKSKAINSEEEKSRMLILMGQPGHGKSSFCYRSMHDMLRSPDFDGNTFFIRLQSVDKAFINTPFSEIQKELKQHIDFEECMQPEFSHQKNVLFLDGLDEMYMTKSLTDGDVKSMIENCKKLTKRYKNLYIIITSRFNYVETSKLYNNDCLLFSLGTLSEAQQKELVEKFTARTPDRPCNLNEATLKRCNEEHRFKFIKELIELPILLQMILISGVNLQNTQSRTTIYKKLFKTVLERKWDKDERLKKYRAKEFEPEDLRRYISLLAYEIYKGNKGYLNKSDVEALAQTKAFKEEFLNIEHEGEGLKDVLKDILTSFYLKEAPKNIHDKKQKDHEYEYAIEFLHKSLYEYLACEHIWTEIKEFFIGKEFKGGKLKYKKYEEKDVLEKVQRMFANIRLSSELMSYLREIIDNDNEEHNELVKRMSEHLPDLLKYGFIYEYKQTELLTYRPEQQVINCFHGFWMVYGQLNAKKIRWADYDDIKWTDFQAKYNIDKSEIAAAYQDHTDEIIKGLGKYHILRESEEDIKKRLQNEANLFDKWLKGTPSKDKNTESKFQYFVKRHVYLKDGKDIHSTKITTSEKEKERICQFLRLAAAERCPMQLNYAFLNLSQSQLQGLIAYRINFEGADLSYADLSHAYLRNADLRNAYLRNADLSNADLSNADLSNAYLRNAYLRNAYLRYAYLSYAYLSHADLSYAYLSHADLSYAYLSHADLSYADLSYADLRNAYLSYADLSNADLSNADLSNADLSYADLSNANLSYADLRNANLRNADLSNAYLSYTKVFSTDWIEQLSSKNIKGLDYIKANYIVSQEKKEFTDRYGFTYEAHEILKKE